MKCQAMTMMTRYYNAKNEKFPTKRKFIYADSLYFWYTNVENSNHPYNSNCIYVSNFASPCIHLRSLLSAKIFQSNFKKQNTIITAIFLSLAAFLSEIKRQNLPNILKSIFIRMWNSMRMYAISAINLLFGFHSQRDSNYFDLIVNYHLAFLCALRKTI